MKILFIDSGLGGLGVMAEVERLLRAQGRSAELLFANGLPSPDRGYNSMDTFAEKAAVFNHVLERLWGLYAPDRIVIACNTLSVVYPETAFAQKRYTPVDEIIETGVDAIYSAASVEHESGALILGTPTTIESRVHETALVRRGLPRERVLSLPCKNLETYIQRSSAGTATRQTITACMNQARKQLPNGSTALFTALCCTHYAFSKRVFLEEAEKAGFAPRIIDPNTSLAKKVAGDIPAQDAVRSQLNTAVVSGYELRAEDVANIAALLEEKAPATSAALHGYELRKTLYSGGGGPAV